MANLHPEDDVFRALARKSKRQDKAVREALTPTGTQYAQSLKKAQRAIELVTSPQVLKVPQTLVKTPANTQHKETVSVTFTAPPGCSKAIVIVRYQIWGFVNAQLWIEANGVEFGKYTIALGGNHMGFELATNMGIDIAPIDSDGKLKVALIENIPIEQTDYGIYDYTALAIFLP